MVRLFQELFACWSIVVTIQYSIIQVSPHFLFCKEEDFSISFESRKLVLLHRVLRVFSSLVLLYNIPYILSCETVTVLFARQGNVSTNVMLGSRAFSELPECVLTVSFRRLEGSLVRGVVGAFGNSL